MKKMKVIDLSHSLTNNTKEYPGDPKLEIKYFKKADEKDSCTLCQLQSGLHIGTHIDSPFHYIIDGDKIINLKLYNFIGKTTLLKTNSKKEITLKNLENKNEISDIVIINTGWFHKWDSEEYFIKYPYLSIEVAEWLIENNIKGIAIDTCSVDNPNSNKIHKLLLKNGIWICENITNLEKLDKKEYEGYFIPLKIEAEASFARAFLKEKEK